MNTNLLVYFIKNLNILLAGSFEKVNEANITQHFQDLPTTTGRPFEILSLQQQLVHLYKFNIFYITWPNKTFNKS